MHPPLGQQQIARLCIDRGQNEDALLVRLRLREHLDPSKPGPLDGHEGGDDAEAVVGVVDAARPAPGRRACAHQLHSCLGMKHGSAGHPRSGRFATTRRQASEDQPGDRDEPCDEERHLLPGARRAHRKRQRELAAGLKPWRIGDVAQPQRRLVRGGHREGHHHARFRSGKGSSPHDGVAGARLYGARRRADAAALRASRDRAEMNDDSLLR
jgi:hypothetical protein